MKNCLGWSRKIISKNPIVYTSHAMANRKFNFSPKWLSVCNVPKKQTVDRIILWNGTVQIDTVT